MLFRKREFRSLFFDVDVEYTWSIAYTSSTIMVFVLLIITKEIRLMTRSLLTQQFSAGKTNLKNDMAKFIFHPTIKTAQLWVKKKPPHLNDFDDGSVRRVSAEKKHRSLTNCSKSRTNLSQFIPKHLNSWPIFFVAFYGDTTTVIKWWKQFNHTKYMWPR